ncbi:MAG TPA: ECF-type sigma factor [Casimicrobiaceae bacterium]|nr:ECF-type sigma factor [Casimicrobiaceae bacterium]
MDPASSVEVDVQAAAPAAADELFAALYTELHRLARAQLRANSGASLSATTLLHEAFLSMRERDPAAFPDRARFVAYAARAMRGVIVDYIRNRRAQKRGGAFHLTTFDTDSVEGSAGDDADVPRIADALVALAQVEPGLSELVDLKFFCGLSIVEIAALRNVSERTIRRDWLKARVYLRRALTEPMS